MWRRVLLTCVLAIPLAAPVFMVQADQSTTPATTGRSGDDHGRKDRVTSDTREYCLFLFDRVSALVRQAPTPPPAEVTELSTEGQRMCDHGQTRPGIMRLRRAVVLMHGTDDR